MHAWEISVIWSRGWFSCSTPVLTFADVSVAWLARSKAAEDALAGAFSEAGGIVPDTGLKTGRGKLKLRSVGRPQGPQVSFQLQRYIRLGGMFGYTGTVPFHLFVARRGE